MTSLNLFLYKRSKIARQSSISRLLQKHSRVVDQISISNRHLYSVRHPHENGSESRPKIRHTFQINRSILIFKRLRINIFLIGSHIPYRHIVVFTGKTKLGFFRLHNYRLFRFKICLPTIGHTIVICSEVQIIISKLHFQFIISVYHLSLFINNSIDNLIDLFDRKLFQSRITAYRLSIPKGHRNFRRGYNFGIGKTGTPRNHRVDAHRNRYFTIRRIHKQLFRPHAHGEKCQHGKSYR